MGLFVLGQGIMGYSTDNPYMYLAAASTSVMAVGGGVIISQYRRRTDSHH